MCEQYNIRRSFINARLPSHVQFQIKHAFDRVTKKRNPALKYPLINLSRFGPLGGNLNGSCLLTYVSSCIIPSFASRKEGARALFGFEFRGRVNVCPLSSGISHAGMLILPSFVRSRNTCAQSVAVLEPKTIPHFDQIVAPLHHLYPPGSRFGGEFLTNALKWGELLFSPHFLQKIHPKTSTRASYGFNPKTFSQILGISSLENYWYQLYREIKSGVKMAEE